MLCRAHERRLTWDKCKNRKLPKVRGTQYQFLPALVLHFLQLHVKSDLTEVLLAAADIWISGFLSPGRDTGALPKLILMSLLGI